MAGEAVAIELDHPNSLPAVRSCVNNASGLILLIDAPNARDGGSDEELVTTKLAAIIHQHSSQPGLRQRKTKLPMAVTFTKCDLCPEAERDLTAFYRHNVPSLMAVIERYFPKVAFFAASATGSSVEANTQYDVWRVPLHIQPKGSLNRLLG